VLSSQWHTRLDAGVREKEISAEKLGFKWLKKRRWWSGMPESKAWTSSFAPRDPV
jgi:hypothetical protein